MRYQLKLCFEHKTNKIDCMNCHKEFEKKKKGIFGFFDTQMIKAN